MPADSMTSLVCKVDQQQIQMQSLHLPGSFARPLPCASFWTASCPAKRRDDQSRITRHIPHPEPGRHTSGGLVTAGCEARACSMTALGSSITAARQLTEVQGGVARDADLLTQSWGGSRLYSEFLLGHVPHRLRCRSW